MDGIEIFDISLDGDLTSAASLGDGKLCKFNKQITNGWCGLARNASKKCGNRCIFGASQESAAVKPVIK